ncbi:MAG TPA: SPOR domain-containing protein [Bryobacteraceae bacterium]|nr:SPOR domain-containing protein [Bryobacteraceae bacterium]
MLQRSAPGPGLAKNSGEISLALHVERQGSDLLITWNRNATAILQATNGILRIRDGNFPQWELRLRPEQLRNNGVLYTPMSSNVQFRMEVSANSRQTANESVLALKATVHETAHASQQHPPLTRHGLSQNPVSYTVQVGTFRNPGNAERLRNEMTARYGSTRLVSQASNPALWRVLVGRETTIEGAGRLAARIHSDGLGRTTQTLVIREADRDPGHIIVK